jgi:hypothetical protein
MQALESTNTGAATTAAASATQPSTASQIAAASSTMQAQELASLFSATPTTGSLLNTQG